MGHCILRKGKQAPVWGTPDNRTFAVGIIQCKYTVDISTESKINRLLKSGQKGGLYFSGWLSRQGYSPQLIDRYRASGWLSALSRGVVYRTGSQLSAFGALASYNQQVEKDLRIAAHSALELWGFNHYVPMGKPILVVGMDKKTAPQWMQSALFDREFLPFSSSLLSTSQAVRLRYQDWELPVSMPEQAFMECLLLAPKRYDYMDLFYIMEQLTTLRPTVVQSLLETTQHYRIRRLFLYMAEKAGHSWFEDLDTAHINIGTHKLQLIKSGVYVSKYKMTVPQALHDYE